MRFALPCALVALAACFKPEAALPAIEAGNFAGAGRDALCIAGPAGAQRGGFIIYGAGNANCSASGRIESAGSGWAFTPAGDPECRIAINISEGTAKFGPQAAACNYYCGPGASFAGKVLTRSTKAPPARDLAGDPLC